MKVNVLNSSGYLKKTLDPEKIWRSARQLKKYISKENSNLFDFCLHHKHFFFFNIFLNQITSKS